MMSHIKESGFANWHPVAQGALLGGIPGAIVGGISGAIEGDPEHRFRNALIGALGTGVLGAGFGALHGWGQHMDAEAARANQKWRAADARARAAEREADMRWRQEARRRAHSYRRPRAEPLVDAPPPRPDFAADATTKAEAKKAWRAAAREHHPDLVTDPAERAQREARMKAINDSWQRWTGHVGSDYHKMASLYGDGYVHAFTKFAAYRGV